MKNRTNNAAIAQTALLILPRLFAFFCADAPYSAAGALGVLLAVIPQAAAALLLTRKREPLAFSPRMLRFCRCGAVLYAADLTVQFQRLCRDLLLPHCGMMLLFLGALLLYALRQPRNAYGRAAELLLFAGAAGLILLPFGASGTLRGIALFMPDSIDAGFFRELRHSGGLLLIPLLMQNQSPENARRGIAVWAAARGLLVPLLMLFGAMQNGRLRGSIGNPFFLLLARSPLTEAIRTDGFWILYAFASGGLCIAACLRISTHQETNRPQIFLSYCAAAALFLLLPPARLLLYAAALFAGITLPFTGRSPRRCSV
ncbi:MAG: hypothetical protein J5722_02265 [Oscillospiraceae bacterium]|nr:hypothetical protein [Oscillospiraceae bacterium]